MNRRQLWRSLTSFLWIGNHPLQHVQHSSVFIITTFIFPSQFLMMHDLRVFHPPLTFLLPKLFGKMCRCNFQLQNNCQGRMGINVFAGKERLIVEQVFKGSGVRESRLRQELYTSTGIFLRGILIITEKEGKQGNNRNRLDYFSDDKFQYQALVKNYTTHQQNPFSLSPQPHLTSSPEFPTIIPPQIPREIYPHILIIQIVNIKMSYSFLLKYIIIGDSGVGKSCLLLQYTDKRYREKHEVTIGVEFGAKLLRINENNIKLQIWDTAGQESFKAITRGYYRNAIGAAIVYDVSNRDSFNNIAKWLEEAKANGPKVLMFVLVGNKSDKQAERKVTYEEGLRFAKEQGIAFLESSAKTGNNVEQIFTVLSESILAKIEDGCIETRDHPGVKVGGEKYQGRKIQVDDSRADDKVTIGKSKSSEKKRGCCK